MISFLCFFFIDRGGVWLLFNDLLVFLLLFSLLYVICQFDRCLHRGDEPRENKGHRISANGV